MFKVNNESQHQLFNMQIKVMHYHTNNCIHLTLKSQRKMIQSPQLHTSRV